MASTTVIRTTTFPTTEEATAMSTTTIPDLTTAITQFAKEAVSVATTTEDTIQSNELDDYYYYDYSELERHEMEANMEYEDQVTKINSILSGSLANPRQETLAPTVYVNQYEITDGDLFVENPKKWDPLENFLELVVGKVYLVLPAFIAGILLGLLVWSIYLMINKCLSNAMKHRQEPQLPSQEFLQIREVAPMEVSSVVVAGKQTLLRPPAIPPSNHVGQGSSSTSSGISSSSSTPVPFESASEGRNHPSTTNSSMRSKSDIPEVLKAVDDLVQTVESAVIASRGPSRGPYPNQHQIDFP